MAKRLVHDRVLFILILGLVTFGLVMVFSASAVISMARYHDPYYFLMRQSIGVTLGLGVMLFLMHWDYRKLKSPLLVYAVMCVSVFLLGLVFLLDRAHNTHRWIRLGFISVQPSEFAKLAAILFASFYLETRMRRINELRTYGPVAAYTAVLVALILFEPDLGTTIAIVAVVTVMLFAAGIEWRYFAYAGAISAPILYLAIFHVQYRRERILAYLHPWRDAQGVGFQIVQSLIAVGTGGVTGLGLMKGKQKLFFLPEPHTDFIFAVICEELGLVGALVLLAAFMILLQRGMRIARGAPDLFGRLLATGVTAMIVVQALINISVVIGLIPNKGIPLPFISYGSSSMIVMMAGAGVLLNLSQYVE
jgi:cell division protein FtsW